MVIDLETPRHKEIIFGDGEWAQIIRMREVINEKGVPLCYFVLKPSAESVMRYNLKEELDPMTGYIIRWYPASAIFPLAKAMDPIINRYLCELSFDGDETSFSKRDVYYKEQIKVLLEENHILRNIRGRTHELLRQLGKDTSEFDKEQSERYKEIIKNVRGRFMEEEETEP